ncbi:dihydrodipicolinate synthase [Devosia geojensis]|uniref:Dihydrodipicolinate synthase n=1 Tax=Devosia geojensis TaxID=443610 RepID=A0A0F5FPY1_9HYPH|nr:dihydrodipicolinate synthase family protein [Devosia geojensis]KKB10883.1 dihydrodipicolinate synthase [Devosia geojensis]
MALPKGLAAFPITPCDRHGRVDAVALRRLVARLRSAGVDAVGLLGSTGTFMYLTREQRRTALEVAVDEIAGAAPLMVGVGALRTDDAVELARDATSIGASCGLLAPVSYTPLTEDEAFEHYSTVAREGGLPLCIYDNPGTTHFRFSPELIARLSQVPGIVGVKSPSGLSGETVAHLGDLRARVPAGFSLGYSGDWNVLAPMIAGADVWHSVLGGLLPGICLRIVRAAQNHDEAEARRLDTALGPVWELFRTYSSLRVVYAMAEILGIARAAPPRPILPLSDTARSHVADVIGRLPSELVV